jgi:galactose mutarotase-like enzyme
MSACHHPSDRILTTVALATPKGSKFEVKSFIGNCRGQIFLSSSFISISSGDFAAEIDPNGAQLSALKDREAHDLLWSGDPGVWAGRAPILFPIVGMLVDGKYRLGSQTYHLPRHGFARNRLFSVPSRGPSSAVFRLSSDAETLKVYPFEFELDIRFEVNGPMLSMTATVCNKGTQNMPASFGWHPAFRWPLPFAQPRSSHFIEFEADEPAPVRRIDSAGLLTPQRLATPIQNRRLLLTDSLFENDALILDQVNSRSVTYGCEQGPRLQVSFPDSPYLGIWTKPGGAQFICIEPWNGVTDAEGFAGDFKDKPGVFRVAPGGSTSIRVSITLLR